MAGMPPREIRIPLTDDEAMAKVLAGVRTAYKVITKVYGPGTRNAMLGMPFGDGVLSHDGVTVMKRLSGPNLGVADRSEADAIAVLRQASEKTNKTAGDGTTTTVVLACELFLAAYQQLMAVQGDERDMLAMKLSKQMTKDAKTVTDYLTSQSVDSEGHLLEVATVSSGDPVVGELIADTIAEVGPEGGITIREQGYPVLDVEKVNGYYFDKGFPALNVGIEYAKPLILVSQKQLRTNTDILPILNIVANNDNRRLIIVGDVGGDAMQSLVMNSMQGKLEAVVIPPPAFGEESKLFMEDIATYVGAPVFLEAMNPVTAFRFQRPEEIKPIVEKYFGSAERVQVNQDRAIIFAGSGDGDEIATRASAIKQQADIESNAHKKEQLEGRYSKLVGKIAIVNVGGSTPTEMEETRFRVEDAIEATKSAMQDGVLPGGGIMIARAASKVTATASVSSLFTTALEATFKRLMLNAAEDATGRLKQLQKAKAGYGFNLRAMTDEPIDMRQAGIWDATRAVVQTVENAASAAGALLTIGAIIAVGEPEHVKED